MFGVLVTIIIQLLSRPTLKASFPFAIEHSNTTAT
jgi:hypothetical protein